ncbi:hypothetical protein XI08_05855 [Bradyrhizobium sp. CCBAU 11361]|nr:hypothetical protein [Bradyrhizobium sp. CCBAU 11361]
MAAMAVDRDATQAHFAHLAEGDLDGAAVNTRGRGASGRARHAAIEAQRWPESNYQSLGPGDLIEPQRLVGVRATAFTGVRV